MIQCGVPKNVCRELINGLVTFPGGGKAGINFSIFSHLPICLFHSCAAGYCVENEVNTKKCLLESLRLQKSLLKSQ